MEESRCLGEVNNAKTVLHVASFQWCQLQEIMKSNNVEFPNEKS